MKFLFYLLILVILSPINMWGQSSASATFTASVTIIKPIEIRTTSNMNFSHVETIKGGSVTLNPDNSRSTVGFVELKNGDLASAATFEVKGQNGYSYDISIPQGEYVMSNGHKEIVLRNFKATTESSTVSKEYQIIRIGATLDIPENQTPGKYFTPTPLEVTVSYN